MFPLFETLAIQDGIILNPAGHQKRYENALQYFYGTQYHAINLTQMIIPPAFNRGLVRCRMNYNAYQQQYLFFPYQRKEIKTFQLVLAEKLNYAFKFTARQEIEKLFSLRGEADEIMMVKNNLITDCSIGNLIFRQRGEWFTPHLPLLNGTQRQQLIAAGQIIPRPITPQQVDQFEEIRIINALNGLPE